MAHILLNVFTFTALLMPAKSALAHSELTANNALQSAAHYLVHTLQAHPWLPFATGIAVLTVAALVRKYHRES